MKTTITAKEAKKGDWIIAVATGDKCIINDIIDDTLVIDYGGTEQKITRDRLQEHVDCLVFEIVEGS